MKGFVISALILLALTASFLWYRLKFDLKNRGYKTHYFYGHFKDLINAVDLIKNSDEPQPKRAYCWIIFSLLLVIILMSTIFFANIETIEDHRCKRFNDYLNHQIHGIVLSKFINESNHNIRTLNLRNGKRESIIPIFVSDLYDSLQPNDSISKTSGNSDLKLYRKGKERTFNVDSNFWCKE